MTTDAAVDTRPVLDVNGGEHDLFAHYVKGGNEAILRSAVTGEEVEALCGKRWVPCRDPEKFPVCPECSALRDEYLASLR